MFTGIVEQMGTVVAVSQHGSSVDFWLSAALCNELKVDQSLSHDGVCLTVTAVDRDKEQYSVTAIQETLKRSSLGSWEKGTSVNLERCLKADGRFDGHIVQGHIDCQASCTNVSDKDGSWIFGFSFEDDGENSKLLVQKGSITVNGVSLTIVDCWEGGFEIAIIPYTYEHTNFGDLAPGDKVNIEFDILGKYVRKMLE